MKKLEYKIPLVLAFRLHNVVKRVIKGDKMPVEHAWKSTIDLTDYNFKRDIDNRVVMSELSTDEAEVLDEILHQSLTFPLSELTEACDVSSDVVKQAIKKFSTVGLATQKEELIVVNKEMRQYYEVQIEKLDEKFVPDVNYVLSFLGRIPIHVLPKWYALPKSTDDIMSSVVETYFSTVKVYDRYLRKVKFENPILKEIMDDVFSAPSLLVRSRDLRKKYKLDRIEFEKVMLLLEFHFICFLSYRSIDGVWREVVTPLFEWSEYLMKEKNIVPKPVKGNVSSRWKSPFAFVEGLTTLLKAAEKSPLPLEQKGKKYHISASAISSWFSDLENFSKGLERMVFRLLALDLAEEDQNQLVVTESGKHWLEMPVEEKAAFIHRLSPEQDLCSDASLLSERSVGRVEKSLRRYPEDWVLLKDAYSAVLVPLRLTEGVSLSKEGRRWVYQTSNHDENELIFIENLITVRFAEEGIVEVGASGEETCIRITPFGRKIIGS